MDTARADMAREGTVIEDKAKPKGQLTLWLLDSHSLEIVGKRVVDNLITTLGSAWLAGKIAGAAGLPALSDIAVGEGSADPSVNDTALADELDRNSLISAPWQGSGSDANKLYVRTLFDTGEANSSALAEAGLFFGGSLFSRVLISPTVEKTSEKVMVAQWKITF